MHYNSAAPTLQFREYGRYILQMVDKLKQMDNKAERQAYAQLIVLLMLKFDTSGRPIEEREKKAWDNLSCMTDYKLDIDSPYEIVRRCDYKPSPLNYPQKEVTVKHYGRLIEKAITRMMETPDTVERDKMVRIIANRMKRNLTDWRGGYPEDYEVARDIANFTEGAVCPDFSAPENALMRFKPTKAKGKKGKGKR